MLFTAIMKNIIIYENMDGTEDHMLSEIKLRKASIA
jgi:hypothetical protein